MRITNASLLTILSGLAALSLPMNSTAESARGIACWADVLPVAVTADPDSATLPDDIVELTTDNANIQTGGNAEFDGPVEIRSRGNLIKAGSARYDAETGVFRAANGVEFSDTDSRFSSDTARYDTINGRLDLSGADFLIGRTPARGSARNVSVSSTGVVRLDKVSYTSCPPGNNSWMLQADSIKLDQQSGIGTAKRASLRFKGVPFLYLPYFTYPITDDRKSGLLFPSIGTSDSRGFEVTQPYYWNVAPNFDMTVEPHYMSKRGLQLGAESRLLTRRNNAKLWLDYLPSDDQANIDRWQYDLHVTTSLPKSWRATTEAAGVSDDQYHEDLSARQSSSSQTHLNRSVTFEYYDEVWALTGRFQGFQTIDAAVMQPDEPYQQLPQLVAVGNWRDKWLGLDYQFASEANYFYRKDSTTGARVNVQPAVSIPMQRGGLYIRPRLMVDYTAYSLQDLTTTSDGSPSRLAPVASIDAGAVFERLAGNRDRYLVTLEPRVLYAYIPFRNQNDLPVFDTIRPDFNLVQLYRYNRFLGPDRLSDTNQLSMGITGRMLQADDGRELLTATVGQTLFFDSGNETLPGEIASTEDSTDYIAELGIKIWKKWNIDLRYQYDTDINASDRTSIRLKYRPGDGKAFNVAYRYARDSLEQTDFSFSYPIGEQWNVIGRYNYSIPDSLALDRFLGVEYESCCWGISLLSRRTVARGTDNTESVLAVQFVLKGFSNFGNRTSQDLQRDILDGTRF